MSYSDRSPVPARLAVWSYLTSWNIQKLSSVDLNKSTESLTNAIKNNRSTWLELVVFVVQMFGSSQTDGTMERLGSLDENCWRARRSRNAAILIPTTMNG